jgi:hypothetical protein
MKKGSLIFVISLFVATDVFAANGFIPKRFNTVTSHDDVYPYILNNAKVNTNTNPTSSNTSNATSSSPVGKRNVVRRKTNARAATSVSQPVQQQTTSARRVVQRTNTSARAANNVPTARATQNRNTRNVVARSSTPVRAGTTNSRVVNITTTSSSTTEKASSSRCFADYKSCMEMYCQREDTAYNRCYCSAKLAQIDSRYQTKIDSLIQQIIKIQYNTDATDEEIKEYWDQTIGIYTHDNPWVNIDNALNIEWPDTQSRFRGQNAFNTGHEYCVKNLRACSYMASNLRDAYKSEIARDCTTYEKSLQKIQAAAESVIESFK